MLQGYLALVLHAHLPYVRHPEHDFFLEEDWLYEAITESYVPLIAAFEAMRSDGLPFRLTLSVSPTLISLLTDEMMRQRYDRYLDRMQALIARERVRVSEDGHLSYLARYYEERIEKVIATWQEVDGDLIRPLAALQDQGHLDILTSAATHGFLPLLQHHPEAVWAQIKVAVDLHAKHFGRPPTGIWLPECGYFTGLDVLLAGAGLRYFVVDTHALLLAHPRPRYGHYAPIFCADSGMAAFGRDVASSVQVWSRDHGYPGDGTYREFYRDIGYELNLDYIGPFIQPNGLRKNTGIKYYRVTGKTEDKELYDPYWARRKATEHAENFVYNRQLQIAHQLQLHKRPPIIVAPFDAELFGHWWYEGPWWLEDVMRTSVCDREAYRVTHLAEYLEFHATHQVCRPAPSSWGNQGFNAFWLNSANEWIYPHLHEATERMIQLVATYPQARGLTRRALNQAARELLLSQASDWAFIMSTGTMVDYATRRTTIHLRRFNRLYEDIRAGALDRDWLIRLEYLDNIFPDLDYRVYRPRD